LGEGQREKQTPQWARSLMRCGARSQDPEIVTSPRQTLNRLSHRGIPCCWSFFNRHGWSLILVELRSILNFCLYEHLLTFPEFHNSLVKNKHTHTHTHTKTFLIYVWEWLISFKKNSACEKLQ